MLKNLAMGQDGTIYLTGFFTGDAVFGKGEANETNLSAAGGASDIDIFLARYHSDGSLMWAKRAGEPSDASLVRWEQGKGVTTLPDGSSIITGVFYQRATFGKGEANETTITSDTVAGVPDGFLARYNADGNLEWAKTIGSDGYEVTISPDGSILVAGAFSNSTTFGKGEPNETTLQAITMVDTYIAEYTTDGQFQWVAHIGAGDVRYTLNSLADGSFYITGSGNGITFSPGENNEAIMISGDTAVYLAKYTSNGQFQWAKRICTPCGNEDTAVASDGSVLITGTFYGATTFDPGDSDEFTVNTSDYSDEDYFIIKLEPSP